MADFSGGQLASNALRGPTACPWRELDHRLGWSVAAARVLTDSRGRARTTRLTTVLLRQRFFALIAGGYADASDHTRLLISSVWWSIKWSMMRPCTPAPARLLLKE